jgi:hypothetical protein
MATKTFYWSGTTGDRITVTYPDSGGGTLTVSSVSNNSGATRSKTLTLVTNKGSPAVTRYLTVKQAANTPPPTEGPTSTPTPTPTGTGTSTPTPTGTGTPTPTGSTPTPTGTPAG